MKHLLLAFTFSITVFSCQTNSNENQLLAQSCHNDGEATCTGSKSCSACKNCKYCKHCSKDGGSCGVCK